MPNPSLKRFSLIAEPGSRALAAQFARLRGLEVLHGAAAESSRSSAACGPPLIALGFAAMKAMSSCEREAFHAAVSAGAILYIRGETIEGARYDLAPLLPASFTVGRATQIRAYRFTHEALIPAALRGEETAFGDALIFASDICGAVDPIVLARLGEGTESPVIFASRIGRGVVICDVQPDQGSDTPLIWRLADPAQRCANIGALIAADRAAGRDVGKQVPFNLTIDDIPLGYDYFNETVLQDFLGHVERRCANFHLDCAWIPTSQRIGRAYVEMLKSHGVGFVWHGIHEHVDHQKIAEPAAEMGAGKRAMSANLQRYGIELQPAIIFPFERAHRSAEDLLLKEGFIVGAEQPRHDESPPGTPSYLGYANESCVHASGLRFLHRYEAEFLTRDRMLALAALGLPIMAFAHPKDVRLRRLSRFVDRGGTFSHFDEVLDFASAKGLRGRSLTDIARTLSNH